MVRKLFRRDQTTWTPTYSIGGRFSSSTIHKVFQPAIVLAFLLVLSGVIVANSQVVRTQNATQETDGQTTNTDLQTTDSNTVIQLETLDTSEGLTGGEGSISTEASINNGQAKVEMKVNGQEVPIEPEGTTHQVITDGANTTTLDVDIQNNQSSTSTNVNGNSDSDSRIKIQSKSEVEIHH